MRRVLNGEIWLANLNPSKVRTVLIVQGQVAGCKTPFDPDRSLTHATNGGCGTVAYPRCGAGSAGVRIDLLIDQLRAIDNRRLIDGPLMRCDSELMMRVYAAIRDVMEV